MVRRCSSSQYVVPIASISLPKSVVRKIPSLLVTVDEYALVAFARSSLRSSSSSLSNDAPSLPLPQEVTPSLSLQYQLMNDVRLTLPTFSGSSSLVCLTSSGPWKPSPTSSSKSSSLSTKISPVFSESTLSNAFAADEPSFVIIGNWLESITFPQFSSSVFPKDEADKGTEGAETAAGLLKSKPKFEAFAPPFEPDVVLMDPKLNPELSLSVFVLSAPIFLVPKLNPVLEPNIVGGSDVFTLSEETLPLPNGVGAVKDIGG